MKMLPLITILTTTVILQALSVPTSGATDQSYFNTPSEANNVRGQTREEALQYNDRLDASSTVVMNEQDAYQLSSRDENHAISLRQTGILEQAERSHMQVLSEMTGVTMTEIEKMSATGMSWDMIGSELGLQMQQQPGSNIEHGINVGIAGHQASSTGFTQHDVIQATSRDPQAGWTQGHGTRLSTGVRGTSSGIYGAAGLHNDHDMGAGSMGMDVDGGGPGGGTTGMGSGSGAGAGSGGGEGGGGMGGGAGGAGGSGGHGGGGM